MHSNSLKLTMFIVVPAAVLGSIILRQQQALSLGRSENVRLRTQIAQPAKVEEPSRQHLAEILAEVDKERVSVEYRLFHDETFLHTLQTKAPDKAAITQALVEFGADELLNDLVEQRAEVVQKRRTLTNSDGDTQAVQIAQVTEQIADLNNKIQQRVDGILAGLEAKAEVERLNLENLRSGREKLLATAPKQNL